MNRNSLLARIGILLIGTLALAPISQAQKSQSAPPSGPVRTVGRAVADADGPFNALGATLFWGAWGYKFDRPRLERNLAVLSKAGVDYVRVLGSVGGESWEDRQTDPRWDDYDAIIAGMTDLAYDRYGLRVQWTVFGGAPFTPAGEARQSVVDRFAGLARGREHKIFAFEIANEAWQNGFEGAEGLAELRGLGRRLNEQTSVLVALSSPQHGAACPTYAGAPVDIMTLHYGRDFGDEGPTLPLRRPWESPAAYDGDCRGNLPEVVFNNEPIGPESSVRADDDPARMAAAFVITFLAGNASYVWHAGPGIRGGGRGGTLKRHEHFDDLPTFARTAGALRAAKEYLPPGLANWTRHEPNSPAAPIHGADHVYSATSGSDFVVLVIGNDRSMSVRARASASIEVRDAATGRIVRRLDAAPTDAIAVGAHELLVLIGRSGAP